MQRPAFEIGRSLQTHRVDEHHRARDADEPLEVLVVDRIPLAEVEYASLAQLIHLAKWIPLKENVPKRYVRPRKDEGSILPVQEDSMD